MEPQRTDMARTVVTAMVCAFATLVMIAVYVATGWEVLLTLVAIASTSNAIAIIVTARVVSKYL